jgi:hypothetical protein
VYSRTLGQRTVTPPEALRGILRGVRFEQPPHLPHDEAAEVLEQALTGRDDRDASAVLIGLALFDDDQPFVEGWCTTVGLRARDPALRGSAALAAGHLARRFGTLSAETREMVYAVAADPAVDGRKHDAVDDVEKFVGGHS